MAIDLIPSDILTKDFVYQICKKVVPNTDYDHDGDIRVGTEAGRVTIMYVNRERDEHKFLRYVMCFGFKDSVTQDQKVAFANKMNNSTSFSRFTIPSNQNALIIDHFLNFACGITANQIIISLISFAENASYAVFKLDQDDLLR